MSQQAKMEATAQELAGSCLTARRPALEDAGLRAYIRTERWEGKYARGSEIRITFWRGTNLIDVIEDFIFRDGQPTASREELQRWLEEGIDDVLRSYGSAS